MLLDKQAQTSRPPVWLRSKPQHEYCDEKHLSLSPWILVSLLPGPRPCIYRAAAGGPGPARSTDATAAASECPRRRRPAHPVLQKTTCARAACGSRSHIQPSMDTASPALPRLCSVLCPAHRRRRLQLCSMVVRAAASAPARTSQSASSCCG
jgi:hypothetical protein